jgi:hypothetical protein
LGAITRARKVRRIKKHVGSSDTTIVNKYEAGGDPLLFS